MKVKYNQSKPFGQYGERALTQLWQCISIDTMEPLTKSKNGHEYLLVVHDLYTKYIELIPLRTQTGKLIAEHLRTIFN